MKPYYKYLSDSFEKNWFLPALSDYPGKTWLYSDIAEQIIKLHVLFEDMNIKPGDKIAICGRNCSNWGIIFLAITTYGTVAVPLLHEFTPDNIHYILDHSGCSGFFVSDRIYKKLDTKRLESLTFVATVDGFVLKQLKNNDAESFQEYSEERANSLIFRKFNFDMFKDYLYHYSKNDLLVLNYTSGTTSNPKGVMIPERAVTSNITFGFEVMPTLKAKDKVVSLLPLAHTYSMSFEFLAEICMGMQVYFLTRPLYPQYIMNAFAEIRPGVIIVVPLLLEKIVRTAVFPIIKNPHVKVLRSLPILKQMINKVIRRKLYNALGGRFYQIIVGGAALSKDVESFLMEIHYPFTVGYGMTECSPIIGYSDWKDFKLGSCGKAAPRMQVKINSEDPENIQGEIMTKGDNVMLGYYKNEKETSAVLDKDGWLKTGDVGTIDKDGNIYIKGRCKTMLLGSNGQNIYPEEIEDIVASTSYISEVLVVQREGKLYALVYPDYQHAVIEDVVGRDELEKYLDKQRKLLNKKLPPYAQLAGFVVMETEFEKTPKKSIKRYLYS